MKKNNPQKKSLKRQLLSGTVYVALAAVVAAVTINTTVGLLSGNAPLPDAPDFDQIKTELPSIPDIPPVSIPKTDALSLPSLPEISHSVSDTADGISSEILENDVISDPVPVETVTVPMEITERIPKDLNMGYDGFIKPCGGYVSKGFSVEVPVYSSTMSDYRTHCGADITGETGDAVYVVCGGLVTDIYDDDLYGKTVVMETVTGYTVKYSNLLPELNAKTKVDALLPTGTELGGIGKTAICEAVEPSHLHIEIYDPEGLAVDPEDLIDFQHAKSTGLPSCALIVFTYSVTVTVQ